MQYFLSVKCLSGFIQEFSQSISKDSGQNCVEVKLLLLKRGEMCYTTEAFKQQVRTSVCECVHTPKCSLYSCTQSEGLCNSRNTGMGLCLICMPNCPRAAGLRAEGIGHTYQSKPECLVLQVICNTNKADSLYWVINHPSQY